MPDLVRLPVPRLTGPVMLLATEPSVWKVRFLSMAVTAAALVRLKADPPSAETLAFVVRGVGVDDVFRYVGAEDQVDGATGCRGVSFLVPRRV